MATKDFLYPRWFAPPILAIKVGNPPVNKALHGPTDAFMSNMVRVISLAELPSLLAALGVTQGHVHVLSQQQGRDASELAGSLGLIQGNVHVLPQHQGGDASELGDSLIAKSNYAKGVYEAGKDLAGKTGASTVPFIRQAYKALVAAIVVTTYAAVETLMIDLWTVAVKLRPNLLKQLNKDLAKNGIRCRDLKEFREVYERTFPEDNIGRQPHGLSKAFAPFYGSLLFLEAARNLYAHRCGVVDGKFLGLLKKLPGMAGVDLKIGGELFVSFAVAKNSAKMAQDFAKYLIEFVDWWLNTHPTP